MQTEIEYLRDENRRKDQIIMQQAMTMRQLTTPREESPREQPLDEREADLRAGVDPERVSYPTATARLRSPQSAGSVRSQIKPWPEP